MLNICIGRFALCGVTQWAPPRVLLIAHCPFFALLPKLLNHFGNEMELVACAITY
jgi:hypothetical protein